jgi:hypothetical protein
MEKIIVQDGSVNTTGWTPQGVRTEIEDYIINEGYDYTSVKDGEEVGKVEIEDDEIVDIKLYIKKMEKL